MAATHDIAATLYHDEVNDEGETLEDIILRPSSVQSTLVWPSLGIETIYDPNLNSMFAFKTTHKRSLLPYSCLSSTQIGVAV